MPGVMIYIESATKCYNRSIEFTTFIKPKFNKRESSVRWFKNGLAERERSKSSMVFGIEEILKTRSQ